MLGDILSRIRKRGSSANREDEDVARIQNRAPRETYGRSAIGIVSNYGDANVQLGLISHMQSCGVGRIVYSGPISILNEPAGLWKLIRNGEVEWVYGRAEKPRLAPEVGYLPSGPEEIEVNGVLIRHFAISPGGGEPVRFGQLQWPPPGSGQQEAIEATARGHDQRIIVIGSGLEYERWGFDVLTERWELVEQNVPGYAETPVVHIELPPEERTVIVHPTSRGSYCSVIEPDADRLVLLML